MLRLLSDEDLSFVAANRSLASHLEIAPAELVPHLSPLPDAGLRLFARGNSLGDGNSGADRPDLARALAKNRTLFMLAVYKVEFRLALHSLGVGKVDISGLVEAFEACGPGQRTLGSAA